MAVNDYRFFWSVLATSTLVTLLIGLILLGLEPRYRATVTLPRQAPEVLIRLHSASFLAESVRQMPGDWLAHPQFSSAAGWQLATGLSPQERAIARLDDGIWMQSDGQFTQLGFESVSPRLAAGVINLLVAQYLASLPEELSSLAAAAADLRQARADLKMFQSRYPARPVLLAQFERAAKRVAGLEADLAELAAATEADRGLRQSVVDEGDLGLMSDQVGEAISKRLTQLQQQRAGMKVRYGDRHKAMIALDREIQTAGESLAERIRLFEARIEDNISRRQAQMAPLRVRLEESVQNQASLESDLAELDRLLSVVSSRQRQMEAVSRLESGARSLQFIQAAVPERPVWPNWQVLLPGVFLATMSLMAVLAGIASGIEGVIRVKKQHLNDHKHE
jgi:uncharacterized protein involved in exopolysaccharide biosynthesis